MRRVCLVSPTHFSTESVIGGGERYVDELARALAALEESRWAVKLVSFGRATRRETRDGVEIVILRNWTRDPMTPFSPRLFRELRGAEAVHCFQYFTLSTFLALGWAHRARVPSFVTDLGGGGWTPAYHFDQTRWITAHLPLSEYAASGITGRVLRPHCVIYGGVNLEKFRMRERAGHDGSIVSLGRILPHKGVHFVIDSLPRETTLHVIGPPADAVYLSRLHEQARGRSVVFHHGLDDGAVVGYLQRAMALVHATPVDAQGMARANELLGLAPLEAMACGAPVIASRTASLPELVIDGETGRLVPPNRPEEIGAAVSGIGRDADAWRRASQAARQRVERLFTWSAVARRAAEAYSAIGPDGSTRDPLPAHA